MKSLVVLLASVLTLHAALGAESPKLSVMSMNCWHRLTKVTDGVTKAADAISKSGADIVGLQECDAETAENVAAKLGWRRAANGTRDVQIITHLPIVETYDVANAKPARAIGAKVRLDSGREVILFNTHLIADHYGPYAAHIAGATPETVLAEEAKSGRAEQIGKVLETMSSQLAQADKIPIFLTGDFNVPSHLDWTAATASTHGGVGPVAWPTTLAVEKAGMSDSFRIVNPDPAAVPGNSWSTLQKATEPQDRIDFVFYKGAGLHPLTSELYATAVEKTIGKWGDDTAPIVGNTWPSDHFAMRTVFELKD